MNWREATDCVAYNMAIAKRTLLKTAKKKKKKIIKQPTLAMATVSDPNHLWCNGCCPRE